MASYPKMQSQSAYAPFYTAAEYNQRAANQLDYILDRVNAKLIEHETVMNNAIKLIEAMKERLDEQETLIEYLTDVVNKEV